MNVQSPESVKPLDPAAIRSDFPILDQTIHRQKPLIYFDNAASSQRPNQVVQAMTDCYQSTYANVHRGTHWLSEESSRMYEEARLTVQKFIGAEWHDQVIFTAGTTSGINLVARSWGDEQVGPGDEILLTLMEHHSNIVPWQQLAERTGAVVRFCGIQDGQVDWEDFQAHLSERTKVVGIAAVSNTLGTINPVGAMVQKAHEVGAIVVVDAAQHVPHEATQVTDWNADFVAFSGHKMLGPSGIGVLYGRREILDAMRPFLGGGSMIKTVTTEGFTPGDLPARFEAGTPPIAETIGLAAAIDYLRNVGIESIAHHERKLAEVAHRRLGEISGLKILGPSPEHTCGIVSFVIDGVSAQDLSVLLDLQGSRSGPGTTAPCRSTITLASRPAAGPAFICTTRSTKCTSLPTPCSTSCPSCGDLNSFSSLWLDLPTWLPTTVGVNRNSIAGTTRQTRWA